MITGFTLGLSLACLLIALTALVVAGWSVTEVQAFKKSTHQVQFVPADSVTDKELNEQYDKAQQESMERLGTHDTADSDSAI